MALPLAYFLTAVDGCLCVAARGADWNEPRYIVSHYPTGRTVSSFCREWDVKPEELRAGFDVFVSMPGEFKVRFAGSGPYAGAVSFLSLTEYAKTKPVATTFEPVPVPRVSGKSRREWCDGRWRIYPPLGKPRVVDV